MRRCSRQNAFDIPAERKIFIMKKKVSARKALKFFEENMCMISSLEAKGEEGCAEKCFHILELYVKENSQSDYSAQ